MRRRSIYSITLRRWELIFCSDQFRVSIPVLLGNIWHYNNTGMDLLRQCCKYMWHARRNPRHVIFKDMNVDVYLTSYIEETWPQFNSLYIYVIFVFRFTQGESRILLHFPPVNWASGLFLWMTWHVGNVCLPEATKRFAWISREAYHVSKPWAEMEALLPVYVI
jgi:hypothetical protein